MAGKVGHHNGAIDFEIERRVRNIASDVNRLGATVERLRDDRRRYDFGIVLDSGFVPRDFDGVASLQPSAERFCFLRTPTSYWLAPLSRTIYSTYVSSKGRPRTRPLNPNLARDREMRCFDCKYLRVWRATCHS